MVKVSDPCNKRSHARQVQGTRSIDDIRLIVMHVAENANARIVAADFSTTTREASAHPAVGQFSCYRCLENEEIPMAAPGANTIGFHIEQAGFASWSKEEWLKHKKTLDRAAYKTAFHSRRFNLPLDWLDVNDLVDGKPGITSHVIVNQMAIRLNLPGDHSHTCPAPPGQRTYSWTWCSTTIRACNGMRHRLDEKPQTW